MKLVAESSIMHFGKFSPLCIIELLTYLTFVLCLTLYRVVERGF